MSERKQPVNTPASGVPAKGPGRGGPARGSWEPFQPGHKINRKHGAYDPDVCGPLAEALADELTDAAPWTAAPAFGSAVESWGWSEAQAALLRRYLDNHGHLDDEGNPRPAVNALTSVENRLVRLRQELGLTPQSLGSLLQKAAGVATATGDRDGLEALREEGARLLSARAELRAGDDDDGDGGDGR